MYVNNCCYEQQPLVDVSGMSRDERIDAYVDYALSEDGPGAEVAAQAFGMVYGQDLAEATKEHVNGLDLPQAQKDIINDAIDHKLATNGLDTPAEVNDMMSMAREFMLGMAQEDMDDAVDEAGGSPEGGAGKADGNWLVQLAKAMSKVAANHLEKMIAASNEIGAMGTSEGGSGDSKVAGSEGGDDEDTSLDSDNGARMTQLTAELQAHTQMFKMVQEATTTIIKTTGEALNGSVRKQQNRLKSGLFVLDCSDHSTKGKTIGCRDAPFIVIVKKQYYSVATILW